MTYSFKLSRRIARLRAPLLAALIVSMVRLRNRSMSLNPASHHYSGPRSARPDDGGREQATGRGLGSRRLRRRHSFGIFAQPTSEFGSRYNGAMRNIGPQCSSASGGHQARGGQCRAHARRQQKHYLAGAISTSTSGRLGSIGSRDQFHLLHRRRHHHRPLPDRRAERPANWGGKPVRRRRSRRWRSTASGSGPAWRLSSARILLHQPATAVSVPRCRLGPVPHRMGDPRSYIPGQVSDAQKRRVGPFRGAQRLRGGIPNGTRMTASEIETVGLGAARELISVRFHQLAA